MEGYVLYRNRPGVEGCHPGSSRRRPISSRSNCLFRKMWVSFRYIHLPCILYTDQRQLFPIHQQITKYCKVNWAAFPQESPNLSNICFVRHQDYHTIFFFLSLVSCERNGNQQDQSGCILLPWVILTKYLVMLTLMERHWQYDKFQLFARYPFSYFWLETGSYELIFLLSRASKQSLCKEVFIRY